MKSSQQRQLSPKARISRLPEVGLTPIRRSHSYPEVAFQKMTSANFEGQLMLRERHPAMNNWLVRLRLLQVHVNLGLRGKLVGLQLSMSRMGKVAQLTSLHLLQGLAHLRSLPATASGPQPYPDLRSFLIYWMKDSSETC